LRVTLLNKTGLLLISTLFTQPSTLCLVDLYTGKIIGSHQIPSELTVSTNTLDIRDRGQDYLRVIEDGIKIREISVDKEGIIPYIREVLGDDELAKSIGMRTGFSGAEDLFDS